MKIAVYTILKNEAHNAPAWFSCTAGADYVVARDTGSTDGGDAYLEDFCAVHRISVSPWRFDDARNASLALVPDDADVCIPLDLDDRLCEGWRSILEAAWTPGTTSAFFTYVFAENYTYLHNRIHARHGYRWRYPCHEGLYPYANTREQSVTIPALRIAQSQDRSKDRSGYLDLLRLGMAENPGDQRMQHYLGRELMYRGEWREAIQYLEAYLRGPALFPHERAETAKFLAYCWQRL